MTKQKCIYMIGGPNGAGKTTSAYALMPSIVSCEEYVNADSIAASLSPFNPDATAITAGKLMLRRIAELAVGQKSFSFETTMASRAFAPLLTKYKQQGYQIRLLYLWLLTPELAKARVKQRVKNGGHHIPDGVVERRYYRSMKNMMSLYLPLADQWCIVDNSNQYPKMIAEKKLNNVEPIISDEKLWEQFEVIQA